MRVGITSFLALILIGSIAVQRTVSPFRLSLRRLVEQGNDVALESDFTVTALKRVATDLCAADYGQPPLNYGNYPSDSILNVIPLFGGMTNALKMILLGALMSYEEGRCFYVDESSAHLNPRKNGTQLGFIQKYMEPIGLPKEHPFVKSAYKEGRVQLRPWHEYWSNVTLRRILHKQFPDIPMIGYTNIEGHQLKRASIRRMWRLLPSYRESTCKSLTDYDMGVEFMAFSVRRGDKDTEKFEFTPLSEYIKAAEDEKRTFGGMVPKIFVATDDCRVMQEFRDLRPDWVFVSECDKEQQEGQDVTTAGFVLRDVHKWDKSTEDAHFRKFFVEIYALVTSKVFVGVSYTNVAWWVFFLRPFHYNFILLDKPKGRSDLDILKMW